MAQVWRKSVFAPRLWRKTLTTWRKLLAAVPDLGIA
jgi:hypothetical protein